MKKIIIPIVMFSALLFSCKKEVIVMNEINQDTQESVVYGTRGQKNSTTILVGDEGGSITDPNNDADEDKKRKGK